MSPAHLILMWKKLEEILKRYTELEKQIQDPNIITNNTLYAAIIEEFSKLKSLAEIYRSYLNTKDSLESCQKMDREDPEMGKLIDAEILDAETQLKQLELDLRKQIALESVDPLDGKDIILEIRAGAGGDEAGLFCKELFIAYERFFILQNWKMETLSCSTLPTGGFREVITKVSGRSVYGQMKYERGVHRVQRVPETESQGRIHTSTVTVAVLPEVEEKEIEIKQDDIRIDVYRSSGAGGQHVNTTDSAVRLTHLPTKLTVSCQDGKSQHANKDKAFKILYARLHNLQEEKKRQENSEMRLNQIGSGGRSEKIRTYNFPQSRVTDHRISFTCHALDKVMKGEFHLLIQPMLESDKTNQ